jgi:hypothetical protein
MALDRSGDARPEAERAGGLVGERRASAKSLSLFAKGTSKRGSNTRIARHLSVHPSATP